MIYALYAYSLSFSERVATASTPEQVANLEVGGKPSTSVDLQRIITSTNPLDQPAQKRLQNLKSTATYWIQSGRFDAEGALRQGPGSVKLMRAYAATGDRTFSLNKLDDLEHQYPAEADYLKTLKAKKAAKAAKKAGGR